MIARRQISGWSVVLFVHCDPGGKRVRTGRHNLDANLMLRVCLPMVSNDDRLVFQANGRRVNCRFGYRATTAVRVNDRLIISNQVWNVPSAPICIPLVFPNKTTVPSFARMARTLRTDPKLAVCGLRAAGS